MTSAIDAGSAAANLTLAQVYEAQQDTANAQTYYQAYVDAGVADSEAMNALAQIEMGKLNYSGALSYIEQGAFDGECSEQARAAAESDYLHGVYRRFCGSL